LQVIELLNYNTQSISKPTLHYPTLKQ